MTSYEVQQAPSHVMPKLFLSAVALLTVAMMAAGMPWFGRITVTVDGELQQMALGTSAGYIIDSEITHTADGDLLDVTGDVLEEGEGEPLVLTRGGEILLAEDRIRDGDEIESRRGDDVTEATVTSTTVIPAPVLYEGEGPFEEVKVEGVPGTLERIVGEVSGSVVSSEVVELPVAMVVERRGALPGEKAVALTFDDGPWPLYTRQILEILDRENVKATFFMLGKQVRKKRDIAAMVANQGHLIGNHSLSHVYLSEAVSPEVVRSEIENCQAEIKLATGVTPTWYRPAGGVTSLAVWEQTRVSKLKLIKWTVDPSDYRCTSPVVLANRVIDSTRPGSVILLHDGGGNRTCTVKALTTIIRELKSRGYTFVTLDEMAPG